MGTNAGTSRGTCFSIHVGALVTCLCLYDLLFWKVICYVGSGKVDKFYVVLPFVACVESRPLSQVTILELPSRITIPKKTVHIGWFVGLIILNTHIHIFRLIHGRQTCWRNKRNHGKVEANIQFQQGKIIVSGHIAIIGVLNFPATNIRTSISSFAYSDPHVKPSTSGTRSRVLEIDQAYVSIYLGWVPPEIG